MEFLDSDLVTVDCIASFDIPDFSIINAVSVYKGSDFYGKSSRDYTDGDDDRFNDRFSDRFSDQMPLLEAWHFSQYQWYEFKTGQHPAMQKLDGYIRSL